MCTKLLRNWSGVVRTIAAKRESLNVCQHQQRCFILPPNPDASKVKVNSKVVVPQIVFKYSPLKYYMSKLRMWKLKWTWDRNFKERDFVEESKRAAVSLTDIIRMRDMKSIDQFSTSNVYYQMANEAVNFPHKSFSELLRFRQQDIRQAVPINVHLHDILGLRYAVIDVVFVGLRHVADCESSDLETMKNAMIDMEPELKLQLEDPASQLPYVFIELFMRFRRNYSNAEEIAGVELQNHTNRWLVSVYKICRFNIFTVPPAI
ncbi:uncharacterized protein LOC6580746 [Drosophila mojavensis]|uniref:Tim44-like domain-containing protein n=1 Tax=Drosophila mojavensis TaxID=7230 RepID=B4KS48_DROMO|nr:uncharacterized protein LOC6580746 [Drosophila mojavensis]EDW10484.1 uncharacterized protein Dmoj_GI21117 [Drosophila mojavensis]